MKYTAVLAFAASASATFGGGFTGANPFSCPGNTNNKCTDKQHTGFDFGDLNLGDFFGYGGFNFQGFTCQKDGFGKRFAPRTNRNVIGGTCSQDKRSSPSFGCGSGGPDKFSLGSISVRPEFDCDLEFHYDMPDGSTCKHRSRCSKSGSTVKNSQCGGAKNVTIVYPSQPSKPKPTCSVIVSTVSFECGSSSTKPPTSTRPPTNSNTRSTVTTATGSVRTNTRGSTSATTSSTSAVQTSSVASSASVSTTATESLTTPPAELVSTTTSATSSVETSSAQTSSVETGSVTTSATSAVETGSVSSAETASTTTGSVVTSATSATDVSTPPAAVVQTTELTSTVVTSYLSTSTVLTTVVSTITSCGPAITNCPARNGTVVTTTLTSVVSTTLCPVTETQTTVHTSTISSAVATSEIASSPVVSSTGAVATTEVSATTSTENVAVGTTTATTPVQTLPCPGVVPSCLNTFMYSVGCSDNTHASCYCPDEIFIKNVFDCIYAHGESDQVVSEAVQFIQGICAPYVPSNPAIATGATITSYVTVSATSTATLAPVYTTVSVVATTVVPVTNSVGEEVPSASSTIVVSTQLTVPQVTFTTGTGSDSSVAIIPATSAEAVPVETGSAGNTAPAGEVPATATNTLVTAVPSSVGTGVFRPTPTPSGSLPVTVNAGGKVTGSFGVAAAAGLMGLVAML